MFDQPDPPSTENINSKSPVAKKDKSNGLTRHIESARKLIERPITSISSGFCQLDAYLPNNGWPLGSTIEVQSSSPGASDLYLTLPLIKQSGLEDNWTALINPPYIPYAPSLANLGIDLSKILLIQPTNQADIFWSAEETLKSDECRVLLVWVSHYNPKAFRRLQLCAKQHQRICFFFHHSPHIGKSIPVAIRLHAKPVIDGIRIDLIKCRGGQVKTGIDINFSDIV